MKAIITVIGHDQVGIVAKVSQKLAGLRVNIIDISQTLLEKNFTMMLMAEFDNHQVSFENVRTEMTKLATETGLEIHIQRQEIFDAIQKL